MIRPNARVLLWPAMALALAVIVLYLPVRRHEFGRYDDPLYVSANPHVLTGLTPANVAWAFTTGHSSNWHPITWLSHMLDAELFGENPAGHHLTSVCLHALNAAVAFALLALMTGRPGRAFCVAALFAFHPLRVESVAWVSERKDVLSLFFFLLMLAAYTAYSRRDAATADMTSPSPPPTGAKRFYVLALVLFALGIMSKPMLVTAPFVLLLLDVWPLQRVALTVRDASWKRLLIEKLPFFGVAAASSWVTYLVQDRGHAVTIVLPLASRLSNAVASYWKYMGKTFWPENLAVFYPHPDTRYPVSEQWPFGIILLAAAGLLLVSALVTWRARKAPWNAVGWFWFVGTLVPVIGLVQVGGQAMADRYTYLPHIGLFIALTWAVAEVIVAPLPQRAVASALCAACLFFTQRQIPVWHDTYTLFSHALRVTRNNAVAHSHVGIALGERGDYPGAIAHFKAAIAAAPSMADGYFGLGHTYELQGDLPAALEQYLAALRLRQWDDWTHTRAGGVLWNMGRKAEAVERWQRAIECNPLAEDARVKLAIAALENGDFSVAEAQFMRVLQANPKHIEAIGRCAELYLQTKRIPEAAKLFARLVTLEPGNADFLINCGGVLWMLGSRAEALEMYARAARAKPDYALAFFNKGTAELALNRFLEAEASLRRALELQTHYPQAINRLTQALEAQGKTNEALAIKISISTNLPASP